MIVVLLSDVGSHTLVFGAFGWVVVLTPSFLKFSWSTVDSLKIKFKKHLDQEKVETSNYSSTINHLKEVELYTSHATMNLLEFAMYLLKQAIRLKRLVFKRGRSQRLPWDEGELQKISVLQELSKDVDVVI
ncbi:hypothetical protein Dimus_008609 [Dionaea muscipula]